MTRAAATARSRHIAGAALRVSLILALALVAACGSSTPTTSSTASVPASTAASAGAPAASSASSTAAERLAAALDAMAQGYTYTSTITVAGAAVSTAEGRSIGGASEFRLTSGGKTVTYRAIPPKAWVQQAGGSWVAVSGKVPAGSPIAGLAAPSSVTVVTDDAAGLAMDASYPPAALGLTGSKAQRVRLLVSPGGTVTVTYETAVNGNAAASTSVFTAAAGLDPITAPS